MKTIILATNNEHKVSEISNALNFSEWEFKSLKEAGIVSDPEENSSSFEGNARIKAQAAHIASGNKAALADDSGLVVDALNGNPGIYSSRYAGENATDEDNNDKLLYELREIPFEKRTARFVCVLVFIDEDGKETVATGAIEGKIGFELQGNGGFGYDPLFYPDEFDGKLTLAEIPQSKKNLISHRGNALRQLKSKLEQENN